MIQSFHLRDILLVKQLQQVGTPLDIEEQLTQPRSPLRSALISKLLMLRADSSTFVLNQHTESASILGLAQIRARPHQLERDVVFMSPALETGNGAYVIWQRLLNHLCVQTAEQGGLRVFARLAHESNELQLFKSVSFSEYCQEEIFQLIPHERRNMIEPVLKLRRQQHEDGWALQKLYASVAPRQVQLVEGSAQGQWDLPLQHWSEPGQQVGYVWEQDGELLGALHIRVGTLGYWVRALLYHEATDQAEALLRTALSLTNNQRHLPVYFAMRQYEAGWLNTLPLLGFEPLASQVLVVKNMTVQVRTKTITGSLPVLSEAPVVGGQTSVLGS